MYRKLCDHRGNQCWQQSLSQFGRLQYWSIGQRLTLFRRRGRGVHSPDIVGDAIVVAIRIDSATIRVEHITDAVYFGDLAALHRQ